MFPASWLVRILQLFRGVVENKASKQASSKKLTLCNSKGCCTSLSIGYSRLAGGGGGGVGGEGEGRGAIGTWGLGGQAQLERAGGEGRFMIQCTVAPAH